MYIAIVSNVSDVNNVSIVGNVSIVKYMDLPIKIKTKNKKKKQVYYLESRIGPAQTAYR